MQVNRAIDIFNGLIKGHAHASFLFNNTNDTGRIIEQVQG